MKEQLQQLYCLMSVIVPDLATYLEKHDSSNMFFCFRWLLVLFKREFSHHDIMRLWEVLWTDLPCPNFHLLLCVAILDTQQLVLMENNYGFTEILKVIPWEYHISPQITISSSLLGSQISCQQYRQQQKRQYIYIYKTRSYVIVLTTKYHLGGQIKKYEMGGTCGMYVKLRGTYRVLVGRCDGKRQLRRSECTRG